jgi:hypothetical protein
MHSFPLYIWEMVSSREIVKNKRNNSLEQVEKSGWAEGILESRKFILQAFMTSCVKEFGIYNW